MTRARSSLWLATLDGVVLTAAGIEMFDCPVCQARAELTAVDTGPVGGSDDTGEVLAGVDDAGLDPAAERACAGCGLAVAVSPVTPSGRSSRSYRVPRGRTA